MAGGYQAPTQEQRQIEQRKLSNCIAVVGRAYFSGVPSSVHAQGDDADLYSSLLNAGPEQSLDEKLNQQFDENLDLMRVMGISRAEYLRAAKNNQAPSGVLVN